MKRSFDFFFFLKMLNDLFLLIVQYMYGAVVVDRAKILNIFSKLYMHGEIT